MEERPAARFDEDEIDDAVLALLHLNTFREQWGVRAWKGLDWDALDRLHQRGLISDPRTKARSVYIIDEGKQRAREAAERLFGSTGT